MTPLYVVEELGISNRELKAVTLGYLTVMSVLCRCISNRELKRALHGVCGAERLRGAHLK